MVIKIRYKLFFVLALTSLASVFSMALSMHWNTQRNFNTYREATEQDRIEELVSILQNYFEEHQSWDRLKKNRVFVNLLTPRWRTLDPFREPPPANSYPTDNARPGPPPGPRGGQGGRRPPPSDKKRLDLRGPETRPPNPNRGRAATRNVSNGNEPLPQQVTALANNNLPSLSRRALLLDINQTQISGFASEAEKLYPITTQGSTVGWLGIAESNLDSVNPVEIAFHEQEIRALYIAFAIVSLLSLLVAMIFSRQFEKPLKHLAQLSRKLTERDFTARSHLNRKDELGELSLDLNILANTLEKNEDMREQWIADTSHELRTPVTILQGEIEALKDKIRQPTDEVLASLEEEINHLAKLIEDLNTLSLAESKALRFDMEVISIKHLFDTIAQKSQTMLSEKQFELLLKFKTPCFIEGDTTRLKQVFDNFLINSFRYSNAPGTIRVNGFEKDNQVIILFEDTPPCPAPQELTQLFNRFYRTETSRNRQTGGRGLGLAICMQIIKAHHGDIKPYVASSGGLGLRVSLPKAQ